MEWFTLLSAFTGINSTTFQPSSRSSTFQNCDISRFSLNAWRGHLFHFFKSCWSLPQSWRHLISLRLPALSHTPCHICPKLLGKLMSRARTPWRYPGAPEKFPCTGLWTHVHVFIRFRLEIWSSWKVWNYPQLLASFVKAMKWWNLLRIT